MRTLEHREHQIAGADRAGMLDQGVEGLVPLGGLIWVGIDQLGEVEILNRGRLGRVNDHGAIFPPNGPKSELDRCDARPELRLLLSKCGLTSLAFLVALEEKERSLSTPAGPGQIAARMGIETGFLVLQRGFGGDCDAEISAAIASAAGNDLLDENSQEVVDAVMTWWREDDGDLVDELVDCLTYLSEGGAVWLFTPKVGRDGHVEPSDIQDCAPTAGLSLTSTFPASKDWIATRLVARKIGKK